MNIMSTTTKRCYGFQPSDRIKQLHIGDTIGCGVNSRDEIYYTVNGEFLDLIPLPGNPLLPLYPVVVFQGNLSLKWNFGSQPFYFDINSEIACRDRFVSSVVTAYYFTF